VRDDDLFGCLLKPAILENGRYQGRRRVDLLGIGLVPGIAGRSPSYLVRQLYDMQAGARHGEWTQLMKPVVAKLTDEDFVNIAAYVSGRMPPATVASTR